MNLFSIYLPKTLFHTSQKNKKRSGSIFQVKIQLEIAFYNHTQSKCTGNAIKLISKTVLTHFVFLSVKQLQHSLNFHVSWFAVF